MLQEILTIFRSAVGTRYRPNALNGIWPYAVLVAGLIAFFTAVEQYVLVYLFSILFGVILIFFFIFFSIFANKDPDLLRSERYSLKKQEMELLRGDSESGETVEHREPGQLLLTDVDGKEDESNA